MIIDWECARYTKPKKKYLIVILNEIKRVIRTR